MICECGGVLQPAQLEAFDMSAFVGHPVPPIRTPGFRCDKCQGETVDGHIVNAYVAGFDTSKERPQQLPVENSRKSSPLRESPDRAGPPSPMATETPRRHLPTHIAREIAVAAQADPRSVQRVVSGQPTKGAIRDRILRVLHARAAAERMRQIGGS